MVHCAGGTKRGLRYAAGHDAQTVVLDFMNPIRTGRRLIDRERQARFDKVRQTAATQTQHACLLGITTQRVGSDACRQRGSPPLNDFGTLKIRANLGGGAFMVHKALRPTALIGMVAAMLTVTIVLTLSHSTVSMS